MHNDESQMRGDKTTSGITGENTTEDKAVVPFQDVNQVAAIPGTTSDDHSAGVSEIPADMGPMMEEMESVLYSISFGKQESVGRTKF